MAYHFRNLIFEGGGVKGIAYVGAMQLLEEKGILDRIKRVGGTSAGAINAVLVGLGYSQEETAQILRSSDFKGFMDDDFGVLRDTNRLLNEYGWFKGQKFRDWIAGIIKNKTGNSEATFSEVSQQKNKQFRDMYFMGTNLSTGYSEVFSFEHTPRWCVADAVRISMSIPLFFASKRSPRGDVYVDGGVLDNYPIKLFDRKKYVEKYSRTTDYYAEHNKRLTEAGIRVSPYLYNQETLGFRLDTAKEIGMFRDQAEPPAELVDDFFAYAKRLVATVMSSQDNMHLHGDDWQRTIYIDTVGVRTTDFALSDEKKDELVRSGKTHTEEYFTWYNKKSSKPANRPSRGRP